VPEVGLAGLPLDYPNTGTEVYVRNLAPLLPGAAPELTFRLFVRRPGDDSGVVPRRTLRTPFGRLDQRRPLWARLDKLTWETAALPLAAGLKKEGLIHMTYFAAPLLHPGRLVVTVHDLVPLAVEGYHRGRASRIYSRFMAWTVPRADAIITVSEHAKRDVMRLLAVPDEKIHVIYEAVDRSMFEGTAEDAARTHTRATASEVAGGRGRTQVVPTHRSASRERYGLPEQYLLYIGGAERRKNIETLVRAWALAAEFMRGRDVRLVIVARFPRPDPLYPDIPRLVRELGVEADVVTVPEVRQEDKSGVYTGAIALCFPSTYEGFGLTSLEAMANGTPVLAADATSLPEVVGEAGWLLPPNDPRAWADAMRHIVDDTARQTALREAGLRRAAEFSWEKTAAQTVDVYRQVLTR
jgi:glycosyltransferase involved in cell wall biosynthesis